MAKITKSQAIVNEFLSACEKQRWTPSVNERGIVTITKEINTSTDDEFVQADGEYHSILSILPSSCGSVWGTDGGGVGALTAMKTGLFTMKKSGVQKRVINALVKSI